MKIYIIGVVGSGKTTLANRWSKESQIPCYELDLIVHKLKEDNRYKRPPEEQLALIQEIDKNEDWIIEGTYRKTCHCLLDLADVIVFLDTPLWERRLRIFRRHMRQVFRLETCHYRPTFEMLLSMYRLTREFEDNRNEFEKIFIGYEDKLIKIKTNEWMKFQEIQLAD